MTDRYETNFAINCSKKIRKRVVSSLIGKGGVNIRRLRSKVGNKTFIKFYKIDYGKKEKAKLEECDTVYISSRSEIAIRKAAKILKMNIRNIKDGSNISEFKELIEVDAKSVGTIIGFKGINLESIMKLAGPYCYIVYKKEENGFLVIGNTKDEIVKAKKEILKRQKNYFINQHIWNKSTQCKDKISKLVNLENIVESDSGSASGSGSASVSASGSVPASKMTLKITNIKEGSSRNKVKQSLRSTKLFKNNEKLMDVLCDLASEQSRIRREGSTSISSNDYDSDLEDDLPALDSESFNWL